jgi:hypothetical protein
MKKIIATLVASVIAASPVMAQQTMGQPATNCMVQLDTNGRPMPSTNNQRFELLNSGRPAEFTYNGNVFYRLVDCGAVGPVVAATPVGAAPIGLATAGTSVAGSAAAAPAAAMAAGFGGMGLVGGLLGLALVAAAVSGSSSSTASH